MMSRFRLHAGGVIVLLMVTARIGDAHHGGANFDLTQTVTFSAAKLSKVELVNPHGWLYFEVTDPNGVVTKHRCEMRSAHVLRQSGWSPDLFPVGQIVEISASPDKKDPQTCYLQTIVFQNGSRMDRYGQYVKAPEGGVKEVRGSVNEVKRTGPARLRSGEPNISGDWAAEQVVMVDPRGTGSPMVQLGRLGEYKPGERQGPPPGAGRQGGAGGGRAGGGPGRFGGAELTDAGAKASAAFKREDNPRFRCETTSIIFDWAFDSPINRITQNRDTIVLQYGQMRLKRTIFMNMKAHPAKITPTRAGHSIGRWEGDVLVVDTTGFLPGVLNGPIPNSDQLHVVERFSLDPDSSRLTRVYEAEDPVFLKGKYTGQDVVLPSRTPYTDDRCKEQSFIDYSKQAGRR